MIMASARNSSIKLKGLVMLLYRYRAASSASVATQRINRDHFLSSKYMHGFNYMNERLMFISGKSGDMLKDEDKKVQPQGPPSQKFGLSKWTKLILSSVLTISLSIWQKWRRLLALEGEVEKVVEEVEEVAEVVQKVATVTAKVSAEVAEKLPGNSLVKEAALVVEHISSVAISNAQLTKDFVHKVEDVKQDLKDLETMAEPLVDKIKHVKIESNQIKSSSIDACSQIASK